MCVCVCVCVLYLPSLPTGLSLEQVDHLWNCLADTECSDDLLSWFLNQAKSKDHHAMSLETFKHIFMEKVSVTFIRPLYLSIFLSFLLSFLPEERE